MAASPYKYVCHRCEAGNCETDGSCLERKYIPVLHAVEWRSLDDLKMLLDRGADINELNIMGQTPLHIAAANGRVDIVKELLKRGADYTITDKDGETFFYFVFKEDYHEINNFIESLVCNIKPAIEKHS